MNNLYLRKLTATQARGNQIDIPKTIAISFFDVSQDLIDQVENETINVCHRSNLTKFEQIEIQGATNPRFSTKLNTFLAKNGDDLEENDLLIVEKLGRSYSVGVIKKETANYTALEELFDEGEKHMLLTASFDDLEEEIKNVKTSYLPYLTALRTKPFMLLAGISGTGKSRIARQIAKACWKPGEEDYGNHNPKNFHLVQVKPNWHDSSELIGFVTRINGEKYVAGPFLKFIAKAIKDPKRPYIFCLDEMNLAPVEQYFAEYLSVIESRKLINGEIVTDPIVDYDNSEAYGNLIDQLFESPEERKAYKTEKNENGAKRLILPPNLFVIGTVNMDETTFSFSRKVLDRAMTIEMNEVDLYGGLTKQEQNELGEIGSSIIGNAVEGKDVYEDNKIYCDEVIQYLEKINAILESTPFKIAYRTRNEFLLYAVNRKAFDKESELATALDEMTSMKILPRIEGDSERVKTPLEALRNLMIERGWKEEESTSLKKIKEMLTKLQQSGYTSYWT